MLSKEPSVLTAKYHTVFIHCQQRKAAWGYIILIKGKTYNNPNIKGPRLTKVTGIQFISIQVRISIYHTQPDQLASTGSHTIQFSSYDQTNFLKLELNKNSILKRICYSSCQQVKKKKKPKKLTSFLQEYCSITWWIHFYIKHQVCATVYICLSIF